MSNSDIILSVSEAATAPAVAEPVAAIGDANPAVHGDSKEAAKPVEAAAPFQPLKAPERDSGSAMAALKAFGVQRAAEETKAKAPTPSPKQDAKADEEGDEDEQPDPFAGEDKPEGGHPEYHGEDKCMFSGKPSCTRRAKRDGLCASHLCLVQTCDGETESHLRALCPDHCQGGCEYEFPDGSVCGEDIFNRRCNKDKETERQFNLRYCLYHQPSECATCGVEVYKKIGWAGQGLNVKIFPSYCDDHCCSTAKCLYGILGKDGKCYRHTKSNCSERVDDHWCGKELTDGTCAIHGDRKKQVEEHKKRAAKMRKEYNDKKKAGGSKFYVAKGTGVKPEHNVQNGVSFADRLQGKKTAAPAPAAAPKFLVPEQKSKEKPQEIEDSKRKEKPVRPSRKEKEVEYVTPHSAGYEAPQIAKGGCFMSGNGRCSTTQKPGSQLCEWHACRIQGCPEIASPELCLKHAFDDKHKNCRGKSCPNQPSRGRVLCEDHLSSIQLVVQWKVRIN